MRDRSNSRLPWFDGPPLALPRSLDGLVERWWAARPRSRVVVAVVLSLALVVTVATRTAGSPHGAPATVLIATEQLLPGDALHGGVVRRASWPSELVPDDAVTEATGSVAALVPAGGVVTEHHLGDGGLAAGVPPDRVAATVPLELLPQLSTGTRLDVIGADTDGSPRTLADDAVVVGADDTDVWLAVDPDAGAMVSAAAAQGSIAVVVRPPRSR
ncbi:MAG: hypothetical protein ACLFRD_00160 [Nitriliruptoraceae bacterium]